jgi:hypothetical protein
MDPGSLRRMSHRADALERMATAATEPDAPMPTPSQLGRAEALLTADALESLFAGGLLRTERTDEMKAGKVAYGRALGGARAAERIAARTRRCRWVGGAQSIARDRRRPRESDQLAEAVESEVWYHHGPGRG